MQDQLLWVNEFQSKVTVSLQISPWYWSWSFYVAAVGVDNFYCCRNLSKKNHLASDRGRLAAKWVNGGGEWMPKNCSIIIIVAGQQPATSGGMLGMWWTRGVCPMEISANRKLCHCVWSQRERISSATRRFIDSWMRDRDGRRSNFCCIETGNRIVIVGTLYVSI